MDNYTAWENVPEHLKTRTALKAMGLRPKRGQKPAAIKTHWHWKTPDYDLFDLREAEPRQALSDRQRASISKAQAASLAARTCKGCGYVKPLERRHKYEQHIIGGYCPACREDNRRESDKVEAAEWAAGVLGKPASSVLILDTETTSLEGQVIELAIIDLSGEVKFNRRFKVDFIDVGATTIHGITVETLQNEPLFADCRDEIETIVSTAEEVLIYNAAFDVGRLRATCKLHKVPPLTMKADCIMEWYAQFCNQWSHYWKSYRWQPLAGDHSALGDCRAALDVLKEMAAWYDEQQKEPAA